MSSDHVSLEEIPHPHVIETIPMEKEMPDLLRVV